MRARLAVVPAIAAIAAASAAVTLPAQTLKNERRHHAWACSLEQQLLGHCLQLPEQRRARIAEVLAAATGDDPLRDLGRALALATGDKDDDELLFRHGLMLFAMPEVVDPIGAADDKRIPHIDAVTITVWAPRTMTLPGKARFPLRIKDAAGKTVWSGEIRKDTGIYELRTFLTYKSVPVGDLADGLYWAEADIVFDNKEPRDQAPALRAAFWVLRGFVKRRLALRAGTRRLQADLDPLRWALLSGSDRVVHRFFSGESGANATNSLQELKHAERVLQNLQDNHKNHKNHKDKQVPPLHGISGWVSVELPNRDMWQVEVALRRIPDHEHRQEPPPPLVVFVPGAPAWNARGHRPRSPESLSPGFLVEMLKTSGFDRSGRWQLVVLESPGRVRNTLATLHNVLAGLEKLAELDQALRFDRNRVFLIGDRQGASGVVSLALDQPRGILGLVLASGGIGAITLNNIDKLDGVPVLVIPGHGHVTTKGILQHYRIAKEHGKAGHIRLLSNQRWPWSIAVPLASREIEAFIAGVLRGPATAPATQPTHRRASRPTNRRTSRPTSRSSR